MGYVDGVVIAVPLANRAAFIKLADDLAQLFLDCGAVDVVDCWGADVPEGKLTSFPLAVKKLADEAVVFSWIEWPDLKTRTAGWAKVEADPRMSEPMTLYDGKRMIYGGFEMIQRKRKGA